jgi:hypothetical protein
MFDAQSIYKRYEKAKLNTDYWMGNLQQCYELSMPNYAFFNSQGAPQSTGQRRDQNLYDPTAVMAVDKYASTLQSQIFGSKNWFKVKPTQDFLDGKIKREKGMKSLPTIEELELKLEKYNDMYFKFINMSNFASAVFQSISEMSISTGVLLVNQTNDPKRPINFTSIPLSQVSLALGAHETIQDVYRTYRMPVGLIQQTWPNAVLSNDLQQINATDPYSEIEIIEGTEYYPDESFKDNKKEYKYFIMQKGANCIMLEEDRNFSPWIIFRAKVLPGETFGRGPIFDLLPFLRTLNVASEIIMRSASFNASPIFLSSAGNFTNNNTVRLRPGEVISIKKSDDKIEQLQVASNTGNLMEYRQEIINVINQTLNLNPIADTPTQGDPSQTATETNIRNDEFIQRIQALYNRIEFELVRPIIKTTWQILYNMALVSENLDDIIYAEYSSPVMEISAQQEIQKVITAVQLSEQIVTDPSLQPHVATYMLDILKVTDFVTDKLNVNKTILRSDSSKQAMIQQIMQQMQQPPQGAQQGQQAQPMVAPQQPQQGMPFLAIGGQ